MKNMWKALLILVFVLVVTLTTLWLCSSRIATTKKDRNSDGKIDYIFFTYEGWADRDYGFLDEDYDGLFELKRTHGIGVFESKLSPPLTLSEINRNHPEKE